MAAPDAEEFDVEAPTKPPDKNKVEKDKQHLNSQIETLEKQLACCDLNKDADARLQQLQTAREKLREQHRLTDERLQALVPLITEMRHAITKLRDKLKYRTAQQVDDAVQRLETQIHTHNFKLREEEKIVREINDLKKSKRTLRDYDAKKRELETLNQKQRALRYERDRLYADMDAKKREENRIHSELQSAEATAKILSEDLEALRRDRQNVDESYKQQLDAWQRWQRSNSSRRRKPRDDAARPPPPAPPPAPELRAPPEPYRAELNLCAQLLSYLQRLSHTPGTTPSTPSTHLLPSGGSTPLSPRTPPPELLLAGASDTDGGQPMFLLRRKDEQPPPLPAGRAKRRRERRGSQRVRPLTHSSEVFHQFCLLDLQPPSTNKDVPAALEQVKAKQKYFQMCALKASQERTERTSAARGSSSGPGPGPGGPPLTLRLNSTPANELPPPPPPDELVTLHSIGVQLPYQLTMAAPASATPPASYHPQMSCDSANSCPAAVLAGESASRPLSRDSGVPSAPLSAEVTEPDRDPFAEALQSRLGDGGAAQRQSQTLEVPNVSQESGVGSA